MSNCKKWARFGVWLVQCRSLGSSRTDAPPGDVGDSAEGVFFVIEQELRVSGSLV